MGKRNVSAIVAVAVTVCLIRQIQAQQVSMPVGSVVTQGAPFSCAGNGWDIPTMTCQKAQVIGCPETEDLGLVYGYKTQPHPPAGTIVLLSGGGGILPIHEEISPYAQNYLDLDYNVIQIYWDWSWERTNAPGHKTYPANILNAACRPATFLNYVAKNATLNPRNLLCAQGASAGSGAIAYALVWYGAGEYVRNVELQVGPVFSNIKQGCKVPQVPPPAGPVNVCWKGKLSKQYGCDNEYGQSRPWNDMPQYISSAASAVRAWTGDASCNAGKPTSPGSNQNWLLMSIVSGTGGNFTFPSTSIAGWLCSSYESGTCSDPAVCPNNSSAQAEYFFNKFSESNHPLPHYSLTGILYCNGPEGLNSPRATTPNGTPTIAAVETDMAQNCR